MTRWAIVFAGLILVSMIDSVSSSSATTGPTFSQGHKHNWVVARGPISRDQAAATARSATGGRVLSVEPQQRRDRTIYRVKVLLKGGRVRVVNVDGQTGELIR